MFRPSCGQTRAALAQLVRALECGSRGPLFNSGRRYHSAETGVLLLSQPQGGELVGNIGKDLVQITWLIGEIGVAGTGGAIL